MPHDPGDHYMTQGRKGTTQTATQQLMKIHSEMLPTSLAETLPTTAVSISSSSARLAVVAELT
ncbi:hypothetical protein E2C01_020075 [Portunus trituberculatus]|uniref:Uncharacterized protein n=1 Tax=Portunus trituberculatus TaxID=210409 RepID=A0A5B7E262_PORTR|nr:hypothetical protein [Portunus trituberculatus]